MREQTISEGILSSDRLGLEVEIDTDGIARTRAGPAWGYRTPETQGLLGI